MVAAVLLILLGATALAPNCALGAMAEADARASRSEGRLVAPFRWRWLELQPRLDLQTAGFAEVNAGFGGEWAVGPVAESERYFEHASEVGVDARAALGRSGTLRARLSGVFSMTGGGVDAGASNAADINTQAYTLEDASLSWESGELLPALGANALELSVGNQRYQVFDGLLFWIGAQTGGRRGALWISPRKDFRETAIARLRWRDLTVEGFHLGYDDDPDSDTRLAGGRVELATKEKLVPAATVGISYFNVYASEDRARDGLGAFYAYQSLTPLAGLPALGWQASLVVQGNSERAGLSHAIGYALAPSYRFGSLPWAPALGYRFASFGGGESRSFDPLFGGLSEWGSWFQGELLGEFVLPNSNLDSHMVRLALRPHEGVELFLLYFKFLLSDRFQSLGPIPKRVTSSALADEIDVILQVTPASWWSAVVELDVAIPDDGFREAVGGSATWLNSMVYLRFHF